MAIPKNITTEHLLKAIERIDKEIVFNPRRKERVWALRYNKNIYPCKLVISYANVYPNKEELDSSPKTFTTYMAQRYLRSKGFNDIINLKNEKNIHT
ncbi:hypothetical protein [Flavobacterium sp. SM2513]|uniref:hypothetical protein n=1 Tax=Flavobacterium sp. SM2513 TaxID=3424766 RepID=UPI003D7FF135